MSADGVEERQLPIDNAQEPESAPRLRPIYLRQPSHLVDIEPDDQHRMFVHTGSSDLQPQDVSSETPVTRSLYADSTRQLLSETDSATALPRDIRHSRDDSRSTTVSPKAERRTGDWMSFGMLALSLYSTFFSAAFLVIAVSSPRYGKRVSADGVLSPSTAAVFTALVAKSIELSFATAFVGFLGQNLARRAHANNGERGITLAEMIMRSWIAQPGTMMSQWESVRYAGPTLLGALSILAAIVTLLYTTACNALVQPQIAFGNKKSIMRALVKTEFGNPEYEIDNCQTPITISMDPESSKETCFSVEGAASGTSNFMQYLSDWTVAANEGVANSDPQSRLVPTWVVDRNTTAVGSWIDAQNYERTAGSSSIIVNNFTVAVPHPGLPGAAKDPGNRVVQPQELDNRGSYSIRAALPLPQVGVMCATMTSTDLEPFVYELWDDALRPVNTSQWPAQLSYADPYLNGTQFDDVFRWGPSYGYAQWPPVFPKLPLAYNTIVNDTTGLPYGRSTIYILAKGGTLETYDDSINGTYALCQLQVAMTPFCSTTYNLSYGGAMLGALCDDPNDDMQYIKNRPMTVSGNVTVNLDWPNTASYWSAAMGLDTGLEDGNGSTARMLTQMISTSAVLDPQLPSLAEALVAIFGYSAMLSAQDSPVLPFWNYTLPTISGVYQYFNASVHGEQYASGGTYKYQKAFVVVLFVVFVLNLMILADCMYHKGRYADFSEPTALFWLAANSPASHTSVRTDHVAPEGDQFKSRWKLKLESSEVTIESEPSFEQLNDEEQSSLRYRKPGRPVELMNMAFAKVPGVHYQASSF